MQVWRAIAAAIQNTGMAPTYDEIGSAIGRQSRGSIHTIVERLCDQGIVRKHPRRYRGLELIKWPPEENVLSSRQHLMWGARTKRTGTPAVVQALSLAFFREHVPQRLQLDPTLPHKIVRVRVTIEEIEEGD